MNLKEFISKNNPPKNYITALNQFISFCETEEVKLEEADASIVTAFLSNYKSSGTYNNKLSAIRKFYRWLKEQQQNDTFEDILNIKLQPLIAKRKDVLEINEVQKLLRLSKRTTTDYGMIVWLLWSGCSRNELCEPYLNSKINWTKCKLTLETTNATRTIYFEHVKNQLRKWLNYRNHISCYSWVYDTLKVYNNYYINKHINPTIIRNTWRYLNAKHSGFDDISILKIGGWKVNYEINKEDIETFYLKKHFMLELLL